MSTLVALPVLASIVFAGSPFLTCSCILDSFSLSLRLASVWATVEFAITGTTGLMLGVSGRLKDYGLTAGALLLNCSQVLSIDGFLAKRKAK